MVTKQTWLNNYENLEQLKKHFPNFQYICHVKHNNIPHNIVICFIKINFKFLGDSDLNVHEEHVDGSDDFHNIDENIIIFIRKQAVRQNLALTEEKSLITINNNCKNTAKS